MNLIAIMKRQENIRKITRLAQLLLVTMCVTLIAGCASRGSVTTSGEAINDLGAAFKKGRIRLHCTLSCFGPYGGNRRNLKLAYDNKLWHDLAADVSAYGFENEQAYFYLAKSAEGLGYYEAAKTYYKLALISPLKCKGGLFDVDVCDGLDFPREIEEGLKRIPIVKKEAERLVGIKIQKEVKARAYAEMRAADRIKAFKKNQEAAKKNIEKQRVYDIKVRAETQRKAIAKARLRVKKEVEAKSRAEAEAKAKVRAVVKPRGRVAAKEKARSRVKKETEAKVRAEAESKAKDRAVVEAQERAAVKEKARLRAKKEATARVEAESKTKESLLICKGRLSSFISGMSGSFKLNITLTKKGGKVIRAKVTNTDETFTLVRKNTSTEAGEKPIFSQLLRKPDRIILRTEVTQDNATYDTEIHNTGAFKGRSLIGIKSGQCEASSKIF